MYTLLPVSYLVSSSHAASPIIYIDITVYMACFIIILVYTHAHTNALSHSKVLVTSLIAPTHT